MKFYIPSNQPPYYKTVPSYSGEVLDATVASYAPENPSGLLGNNVSAMFYSAAHNRMPGEPFQLYGTAYLPAKYDADDIFFCWIYMRNLLENNDLAVTALGAEAFSDEGEPGNCPGKALAMFSGMITSLEDPGAPYEQFVKVVCPKNK